MRRKRKVAAAMLACLCLSFSAAGIAGCATEKEDGGGAKIVYSGFEVATEVTADFGTTYTLPTFSVTDGDGNVYAVEAKVTLDGEEVPVVAGQIELSALKDYVVTFTLKGTDVTKTMTVHVADRVNPAVTVASMDGRYFVGKAVALPAVEVRDNADANLSYTIDVYKGETKVFADVKEAFTPTEEGAYTLRATAKDNAGNEGFGTAEFIVCAAAAKGEIVDYTSQTAADITMAWNNNDSSPIGKEYVEWNGKTALKVNTKDAAGPVKYPAVAVSPAMTKAEIVSLQEAGFTYVSVEYYIDYTAKRTLYQKWSGKQASYATVLNEWATVNLPLDSFAENYDAIAAKTVSLFYLGNDEAYTVDGVRADFDFYISSIYVTKDLDDVTISGVNETVTAGSQVDLSSASAVSASADDLAVKFEIYDAAGNKLTETDGKVTLATSGVYTLKAVSLNKCYRVNAYKEIVVPATKDEVNALIGEILGADDISSMGNKAAELSEKYEALTEEDKAEVNYADFIAAVALDKTAVFAFNSVQGKAQISLAATLSKTETVEIATKNYVTADTTVKYGDEAASTKVAFADYNTGKETWFAPFVIRLNTPVNIDTSKYNYVRMYIQGYCYKADRPITYTVTVNDKRIEAYASPVEAPNREWKEVLIPASAFAEGNQVALKIYTHKDNDLYGAVWNDASRMYVNLSLAKAVSIEETTEQPAEGDAAFIIGADTLSKVSIISEKTAAAADSYGIDTQTVFGKETASLKYTSANASAFAEYISFNEDKNLNGYGSVYFRLYVSSASANAKKGQVGYAIYKNDSRVIDVRHNFLKTDAWNLISVPASLVGNLKDMKIVLLCNKWDSATTGLTVYVSSLYLSEAGAVSVVPVAYGKDYSKVWTEATFNGKTGVTALSTNPADGSASNARKWPGVRSYNAYTAEELTAMKEAGVTALAAEIYIADAKQATQQIKWGASPNDLIATVNTNEWVTVTLDIDVLIANAATYFGQGATHNATYLFYVDNNAYGTEADSIKLYVGGAAFVK